jgi:hypothetical protein
MDFKVGDQVRVCFPEDMRPLRWDSVQALMDGQTGTIVQPVSGFWVVRFDQPIEIVPGSHAEQIYGREVEEEPVPAAWLRKMADVGGLPISAAVASDDNPISNALARNACNSAKVAVGVSRDDDFNPIAENGFTWGSLPGLRRAATFQARRQVFMAWLTVVRRSRSMMLPSASVSLTTSSFS